MPRLLLSLLVCRGILNMRSSPRQANFPLDRDNINAAWKRTLLLATRNYLLSLNTSVVFTPGSFHTAPPFGEDGSPLDLFTFHEKEGKAAVVFEDNPDVLVICVSMFPLTGALYLKGKSGKCSSVNRFFVKGCYFDL